MYDTHVTQAHTHRSRLALHRKQTSWYINFTLWLSINSIDEIIIVFNISSGNILKFFLKSELLCLYDNHANINDCNLLIYCNFVYTNIIDYLYLFLNKIQGGFILWSLSIAIWIFFTYQRILIQTVFIRLQREWIQTIQYYLLIYNNQLCLPCDGDFSNAIGMCGSIKV